MVLYTTQYQTADKMISLKLSVSALSDVVDLARNTGIAAQGYRGIMEFPYE